jgi:hypothetical protein
MVFAVTNSEKQWRDCEWTTHFALAAAIDGRPNWNCFRKWLLRALFPCFQLVVATVPRL